MSKAVFVGRNVSGDTLVLASPAPRFKPAGGAWGPVPSGLKIFGSLPVWEPVHDWALREKLLSEAAKVA